MRAVYLIATSRLLPAKQTYYQQSSDWNSWECVFVQLCPQDFISNFSALIHQSPCGWLLFLC
ncbi:hypothetical protein Bca4012_091769 [Brassica carinata]